MIQDYLETKSSLKVSEDGLVRISFDTFNSLSILHLYSELDISNIDSVQDCESQLSGFTEWVSNTMPILSISWDWKFDTQKTPPRYVIEGQPYSNIMFIDDELNRDEGSDKTLKLLYHYIEKLNWQTSVINNLNKKYS